MNITLSPLTREHGTDNLLGRLKGTKAFSPVGSGGTGRGWLTWCNTDCAAVEYLACCKTISSGAARFEYHELMLRCMNPHESL